MLKSQQRSDAPLPAQVAFWNEWNAATREASVEKVCIEQADTVLAWLRSLDRTDLDIIDVGCGAGWLAPRLTQFGKVTGTDLSDQVLARAAVRAPSVKFVAGDFMNLDFANEAYDVVVSLEVLPHVKDQPAFLAKIAAMLRPNGYFMLATQNRPQLERNDIPPPEPGQIRRWVDRHELKALLSRGFEIEELFSITPKFNRGYLRYLNSQKLHLLASAVGMGAVTDWLKKRQEKAWRGWTLMALARKRTNCDGNSAPGSI